LAPLPPGTTITVPRLRKRHFCGEPTSLWRLVASVIATKRLQFVPKTGGKSLANDDRFEQKTLDVNLASNEVETTTVRFFPSTAE
jgi:hypothetical protein